MNDVRNDSMLGKICRANPNGYRCKVFRVDDGGTHWIAARNQSHAYEIMADIYGYTREEYVEELDPSFEELKPHETVRIIEDGYIDLKKSSEEILDEGGYPEGSRVDVNVAIVTNVSGWMKSHFVGVICTTEV